MPSKTVYVSEEDLGLFQRAQDAAGGNLSAAIAQALRRFVEVHELTAAGLREVTVTVGPAGSQQRKRFIGLRIARWRHRLGTGRRAEEFVVYRTAHGRLAVHIRDVPDWSGSSDPEAWMDPETWNEHWWEPGESRLEVFETAQQLEGRVPPELCSIVARALEQPVIEDLDI